MNLPICEDFLPYDLIMLTGGEPMLHPDLINKAIDEIREKNPWAKLILYTADLSDPWLVAAILNGGLDGITITLHEQKDLGPFSAFLKELRDHPFWLKGDYTPKTLRLNVFKGIKGVAEKIRGWNIKRDIEWIKDCSLPEGETFMRWKP